MPANYNLNAKQLTILRVLYRFRFATSALLSQSLNIKHISNTHGRLTLLEKQKYIGKMYSSEYKLLHKPASYYLLPVGIKALRSLSSDRINPTVLHKIYSDKNAGDQFIKRCLGLLTVYCRLYKVYGDRLKFFTESEISAFDMFPKPRPHGYIRLDPNGEDKQFFVEFLQHTTPFFKIPQRFAKYKAFAEEGTWDDTGTPLPAMLYVCDNDAVHNWTRNQLEVSLENYFEAEPRFYTAKLSDIQMIGRTFSTDKIWHKAGEDDAPVCLNDI
jgi:hypothetical protein